MQKRSKTPEKAVLPTDRLTDGPTSKAGYRVVCILLVAEALDGQRYPLPQCEYVVCEGERGSGPEGADDLCLVSFEALGLNLSIKVVI